MIYFNLFPRCGSAFLATLSSYILDSEVKVIREPDKYKDKINQIVVFRDPFKTLSSVIERSRYTSFLQNKSISWTSGLDQEIEYHNKEYIRFIDLALDNFSNLYCGVFDQVMTDPVSFLKKAGTTFNLKTFDNVDAVEMTISTLKNRHKSDSPTDYGHYLRDKDMNRLLIEESVTGSKCLDESFDKYKRFVEMVSSADALFRTSLNCD